MKECLRVKMGTSTRVCRCGRVFVPLDKKDKLCYSCRE